MVTDLRGTVHSITGILDTGAPSTEFSDQFLIHTGFLAARDKEAELKPGLQTQKYGIVELPSVVICGHHISPFKTFISYFEPSWGIDALVGLDFFRNFLVQIDYKKGILITSAYET